MDAEEQHQAERRVRELLRRADTPETVESLSINPGHLKLHSLAPLAKCRCLRRLDASRNALKSLEGAERLQSLEILNLYANKLGDLGELLRLQALSFLTEVDLRLNPVAKQESYRLFAIKYLPRLRRLDGSDITAVERSRADCLFANLDCHSSSGEGSDDGEKEDMCAVKMIGASDDPDSPSICGRENVAPQNVNSAHASTPRAAAQEAAADCTSDCTGTGLLEDRRATMSFECRSWRSQEPLSWSRGLEDLLRDKEAPEAVRDKEPSEAAPAPAPASQHACPSVVGRRGSQGTAMGAASVASSGYQDRGVKKAVKDEVAALVKAQETRVAEVEARLAAAIDDAHVWRTRAAEAEKRAAAAEAKLAGVLATGQQHVLQPLHAHAYGPAAPAARAGGVEAHEGDAGTAVESDKMAMAEMLSRERQLVDMLQESHTLLVANAQQVRADLEAERAARRRDAATFEENWREFLSLRTVVEASPAFSGQVPAEWGGHSAPVDAGPHASASSSYSVGCLPLSAAVQARQEAATRPPAPRLLASREGGEGAEWALSKDEAGQEISALNKQQEALLRHMRALELDDDMALAGSDDGGDAGCEPHHLGDLIANRQVPVLEAGTQDLAAGATPTSATLPVPQPECGAWRDTLEESQHLQFMRALEMDEDGVL